MTRPVRLALLAALLGVLLAGAPRPAPAQFGRVSRAVSIRSTDGRVVAALQVESLQRPAAAVVLLPMLGRPKEDWQTLAERLADANITALAVDLPGQALPGDAQVLATWHTVALAAVDYLVSRPEIRPDSIGLAGASLGANLAALAAAADSRVRSLALVSPSLDYRGVRIEAALRQYGARPALLLASRRDPYAARSVRELAANPPGLREAHWSETAAHGTMLVAREPDLTRLIVDWFQRTLG